MILESSSKNFENTSRGFRAVVFDVFGDTVYRPNLDTMFNSSKEALKDFETWAKEFDVQAYYMEKIKQEAAKLKREAERLEGEIGRAHV